MRKAERRKASLRLGISGPAGSGKTYGSLLVAFGITGDWESICLIDTENHSGELYANLGSYNYIEINTPYTPEKYIAAIKECESAGIKCIIVDSLTHAWSGEGGLLDKKGQIEKKTGNGWTAWRDITPQHNRLVESILQSKCHLIATLRAKMDYVQEKQGDRTVIRKIGMNPIQREGMEYEFTSFIDVDQDHQATTSKDRTSLFDGKTFMLSIDTGKQLLGWLEQGADAAPSSSPDAASKDQFARIFAMAKEQGIESEDIKKAAYHFFKIDSMTKLTIAQAGSIIEKMPVMWAKYQEECKE
jgi:hypothetical protein